MNSVQPNRSSKATSLTMYSPRSAGTFWVSSITADLLDGGRDRLARGRGRLRDVEGGSVGVVTAGVVPVGG